MRIWFTTEGGLAYFPGLSAPVIVDGSQLPPEEAAALERLVNAADFFDLPPDVGAPPPGAADFQQYTITVEAGGRRHTVRLVEPITQPDLRALVDALRAQVKAQRAAARTKGRHPDDSG